MGMFQDRNFEPPGLEPLDQATDEFSLAGTGRPRDRNDSVPGARRR